MTNDHFTVTGTAPKQSGESTLQSLEQLQLLPHARCRQCKRRPVPMAEDVSPLCAGSFIIYRIFLEKSTLQWTFEYFFYKYVRTFFKMMIKQFLAPSAYLWAKDDVKFLNNFKDSRGILYLLKQIKCQSSKRRPFNAFVEAINSHNSNYKMSLASSSIYWITTFYQRYQPSTVIIETQIAFRGYNSNREEAQKYCTRYMHNIQYRIVLCYEFQMQCTLKLLLKSSTSFAELRLYFSHLNLHVYLYATPGPMQHN